MRRLRLSTLLIALNVGLLVLALWGVTVVAVRFDGDGLAAAASGDGAGYQPYHVPEDETADEPTTTVELHRIPNPEPAPVVAEPVPTARWHGLLLAAAVVALIALILTVIL